MSICENTDVFLVMFGLQSFPHCPLRSPRDPRDEDLSRGFPAPPSFGSRCSGTQTRGGGSWGGHAGSTLSSVCSQLSLWSEVLLLGAGTGALLLLRLELLRFPGPPLSPSAETAAGCSAAPLDSLMVFSLLIGTRERDEERGDTPENW